MKKRSEKRPQVGNKLPTQLIASSYPVRREAILGRELTYKQDIGPIHTIDLVSTTTSSSVVTGNLASVIQIGNPTAMITNFSTRWSTCFREYRVVGVRWETRLNTTGASPGSIWVWMDEKDSNAPSSSDAATAARAELSLQSNTGTNAYLARGKWKANDLVDFNFTATSTGVNPLYLKLFAGSITGTAGASTGTVLTSCTIRIQFRGVL